MYCSPSLFAIAVLLIVSYPFQRCVSVVSLFIYFCYNLCLGICTYSQSVYNIFLSLLITQNWLYCKQHQHNGIFVSHCHYSKTVSLGLATLKAAQQKKLPTTTLHGSVHCVQYRASHGDPQPPPHNTLFAYTKEYQNKISLHLFFHSPNKQLTTELNTENMTFFLDAATFLFKQINLTFWKF